MPKRKLKKIKKKTCRSFILQMDMRTEQRLAKNENGTSSYYKTN